MLFMYIIYPHICKTLKSFLEDTNRRNVKFLKRQNKVFRTKNLLFALQKQKKLMH